MMKVFLSSFARRELDEACSYYEMALPGLGKRFKLEVRKAIQRIQRHPRAWVNEHGENSEVHPA